MGKEASSRGKKRSLFWIGLIVLIVMMGALGWQAKSLLQPPPTKAPAPVRAKVPPAPQPTTIQITEPSTPDTMPSQENEEDTTQALDADAPEPMPSQQDPLAIGPEANSEEAATVSGDAIAASEPATGSTESTGPATEEKTAATGNQPDSQQKMTQAETPPEAITPAPDKEAATINTPATDPESSQAPAQSKPTPDAEIKAGEPSPPKADSETAPSAAPAEPAPYTIQVGAFRNKSYAVDKIAKLTRLGYEAYLFEIAGANQKPWYTVRFGHFNTRDQAAQALMDFKEKEKMDGVISRSDSL